MTLLSAATRNRQFFFTKRDDRGRRSTRVRVQLVKHGVIYRANYQLGASGSRTATMSGLTIAFLLLGACQVSLCAVLQTSVAGPNVISRSQWGARQPKSPNADLTENPPPYVVIHHSATIGCTTQATCQARVRSFQNYHMNENGWSDIGYNFLVGEDGNAYEGRGWGKKGAHSTDYNGKSIGICIIGDFTNREPNTAAVNAAKGLIAYGVSAGKIKEDYILYGHRQTKQTNCPGDKLYDLIKTWPHWERTAG